MNRAKETAFIPARAILIGLILLPINAYWITIVSELWATMIGMNATSLFFNAVFNLFFLILINLPLRKFLPNFAFSRTELLTIYVMLVMLSTVCGYTMMSFVIGALTHPFWFATPENEYAVLFHRYIPSWFTVSDKRALRGFFEGGESFHTAAHFSAWLIPVLVWTGIIFAIFFTFICVNIIIRKQWTEQDKLSYPIIQVPIELTAPRTICRPLLWIGFSVSALIEIINGLHHLFPVIPGIPLHYVHTFTERPWTLGWMRFSFNPFVDWVDILRALGFGVFCLVLPPFLQSPTGYRARRVRINALVGSCPCPRYLWDATGTWGMDDTGYFIAMDDQAASSPGMEETHWETLNPRRFNRTAALQICCPWAGSCDDFSGSSAPASRFILISDAVLFCDLLADVYCHHACPRGARSALPSNCLHLPARIYGGRDGDTRDWPEQSDYPLLSIRFQQRKHFSSDAEPAGSLQDRRTDRHKQYPYPVGHGTRLAIQYSGVVLGVFPCNV